MRLRSLPSVDCVPSLVGVKPPRVSGSRILDSGFTTEGLHRSKRWEKNEGSGSDDLTAVQETVANPIQLLSTETGAVQESGCDRGCC